MRLFRPGRKWKICQDELRIFYWWPTVRSHWKKLLLAMMAVLTCASGVSGNYTYWAYIPNLPLLLVVDWTESSPVVFTNDSLHFPAPWSDLGPRIKEGKTVNLTLMYPVLPICFGSLPLCLCLYPQWWAYCFSNGSFRLGMLLPWPLFLIGQRLPIMDK